MAILVETKGRAILFSWHRGALWWGSLAVTWVLACVFMALLQSAAPQSGFPWLEDPQSHSDKFWSPREQNAHRRLPFVSADLASIHMHADGLHGWAVGSSGVVIATTDGGKSWDAQNSTTNQYLSSVQFLKDGLRGWAVSGSEGIFSPGSVIATADGGKTWAAQNDEISGEAMSVSFLEDGLHGWVAGRISGLGIPGSGGVPIGFLSVTVDGGKNWTRQSNGFDVEPLMQVHFLKDGVRGWAVGEGGFVMATGDAGQTWEKQDSGTPLLLASIRFLDDGLRGWAAGEKGVVIATRNGGKTWDKQISGTTKNLSSLQFHENGLRGWAVGEDGLLLITSNGGKTWTEQRSGTWENLYSVQFLKDGLRGWVAGDAGTVMATSDGGKTWDAQTKQTGLFNSVQFLDDGRRGWALSTVYKNWPGADGRLTMVMATIDGGKTWIAQTAPSKILSAVRFHRDGLHGWAVGRNGFVMSTKNGGKAWDKQQSRTTEHLSSVQFLDDGLRGWAVGKNGVVIATVDGGNTWKERSSSMKRDLASVLFLEDGQRGWTVSESSLAVNVIGNVMATADGGKNWDIQSNGMSADLSSVQFLDNGLRGWAVDGHSVVVTTDDGGKTWDKQNTGTTEGFSSVQFLNDGFRGWTVGANGIIFSTINGGKTWAKQNSGTTENLSSVQFLGDGLRGWAVGDHSTVIITSDGGKTWLDAWAPYRRYPAPWFWIMLAPALGFLLLAWKSNSAHDERHSVADVAASDAAVQDVAEDRLDFAPLARGISRFLRNDETKPPLTLAITGGWGTGKTSLMRLTCADLRNYGYRPIWFNAWHYQKEEHLFAALLGTVREQIAPPSWHLAGMAFRMRLLWLRSKKHWFWAMLLMTAASALATWLWVHDSSQWNNLWNQLRNYNHSLDGLANLFKEDKYKGLSWLSLLAPLSSGLGVILGLRKGLTAIGADPAALIAGAANHMKLKDATEHNTFRMKFSEQFNEVTQALHGRMVIFIDDLDRCKPEAVLEIMEAVNFLTTAGECFVIFGMAPDRVQAALGIAFERIAKELIEEEQDIADKEVAALKSRRAFARDYLQKLVNVEIKVPARNDLAAHRLLVQEVQRPTAYRTFRKFVCILTGMAPVAALTCAIIFGIFSGMFFEPTQKNSLLPTSPSRESAATMPPTVPANTTATLPSTPTGIQKSSDKPLQAPSKDGVPITFSGSPQATHAHILQGETSQIQWLWVGLPLLGIGLALVFLLMYRLRQTVVHIKDSFDFRQALEIWAELVALHHNTPRAIKRFGNRIRYFAMLQQGAAEDRSIGEQLTEQLYSWWKKLWNNPDHLAVSGRATPKAGAITEPQLIALCALHEVWGEQWRLGMGFGPGLSGLEGKAYELQRFHCQRFHVNWPPSSEELQIFDRLLAGIRLSGDAEVVQPAPSDVNDLEKSSVSTSIASTSSAAA